MGSTHDLLGNWVSDTRLLKIFKTVARYSQHTYLFLTKNPARYEGWEFLEGEFLWFGVSIDTRARINEYTHWLAEPLINYISAEPLLEDIGPYLPMSGIKGIIVGAQSGAGALKPEKQWVLNIVKKADKHGVKVFLKDSLFTLYPDLPERRELPWPLFTKSTELKR